MKHIVALLMLAVVLLTACREESVDTSTRQIAAILNGENIYLDEVERELLTVPEEQRGNVSQIGALDFIVERKLLLEQAAREGITVSTADVAALANGTPIPHNLTYEEAVKRLSEQAAITKLLERKTSQPFVVSDAEVRQIYDTYYDDRNITFEAAENEIVQFIIEKKKENMRTEYINNLKRTAELDVFIDVS